MPLLPALRSEILKRSCDPFLRISLGSQKSLINFWEQIYLGLAMSTLGILFPGEERAAMAIWECEHSPGQNVLMADVKSLNQDP
jgi:hypothetical protein